MSILPLILRMFQHCGMFFSSSFYCSFLYVLMFIFDLYMRTSNHLDRRIHISTGYQYYPCRSDVMILTSLLVRDTSLGSMVIIFSSGQITVLHLYDKCWNKLYYSSKLPVTRPITPWVFIYKSKLSQDVYVFRKQTNWP